MYKEAGFYTRREGELQKCLLNHLKESIPGNDTAENCFKQAKNGFDLQKNVLEETEIVAERALEYAFDFMEQAFENGQEMIVFVTELTLGKEAVLFFSKKDGIPSA